MNTEELQVGEKTIHIYNSLPKSKQLMIIDETLKKAKSPEGYFYSQASLSVLFNLTIAFYYVQENLINLIDITDADIVTDMFIYDKLEEIDKNFFDKVIEAIPSDEYNFMFDSVVTDSVNIMKYQNSLINFLGELFEKSELISQNFQGSVDKILDKQSDFHNLIAFAEGVNNAKSDINKQN